MTGAGLPPGAFAALSASNKTTRMLRPTPDDNNLVPNYAAYIPGLPEFLQGFSTFEQGSSYITFFKQQAISGDNTFLPLQV